MDRDFNPQTPAGSRRSFLKATGLVSASALAASGFTKLASADDAVVQPSEPVDISTLPRVKQVLVDPPFLPDHQQVADTGPKIVEIKLPIIEKKMQLDKDGTEVWAFTYNGSVPGPMIVVHEGDYVEVTLQNVKENTLEHNIDFHAATGALGGGALPL